MSSAVCKKKRALSSWYVMYCLWISCKIPARITACKSVSAKKLEKKGWGGCASGKRAQVAAGTPAGGATNP